MHESPTLYMFAGPPGAGKTTAAQIIEELTGAEHIWTDRIRHEMFGEHYNSADSEQLYKFLNSRAEDLMHQGKSVIFDTNFSYYKDRQLMREIAARQGGRAILIHLTTPVELARSRAVGEEANGPTRQYTSMTDDDFDRIVSHYEPPRPTENPIEFNGVGLSKEVVARALDL